MRRHKSRLFIGMLFMAAMMAEPAFAGAPGSLIGFDSNTHGSAHVRCVLSPITATFFNMRPGHSPGYYKMNMECDNSPGTGGLFGGGGHIQGVSRLYVDADHPYFALSRGTTLAGGYGGGIHTGEYYGSYGVNNEWTSGTPAWPTENSKRIYEDPGGDVIYNDNVNCRHPGGLSAIGDYLVTGWDPNGCSPRSIEIYDVSDPTDIELTKHIDQSNGGAYVGSANVAIVRLDDPVLGDKFLLAAGGTDMNTVEFLLCDDLDGGPCVIKDVWEDDDSATNHGYCWSWWSSSQYFSGIQFVVECGSGQVYMVGTNERDNANEAHLYKVTYSGSKFHLEKTCGHESFPETHGINFDGGASVYVDPTGRLQMYASGKCQGGSCTTWNDTVIGQFWNDEEIGLWSFEGNANDGSGYGNHGTPMNGAAFNAAGPSNQALDLDGQNDYVRIISHSTFNGLSSFSLSAWVYPTELNTHNSIISKVNPLRDFVLKLTGSGQLNAHFYDNGYRHCTSAETVPLYAWSHVEAEWTGTRWKLYMNGNLVKTCDHTGHSPPWTGTRMGIGTMSWGELFTGSIDEVTIR